MIEAALIDKGLSYIDTILERVNIIKEKKLSTQSYLRAYYIEVLNNIEFLNIVKLSNLKNTSPNSKDIKFIIDNLVIDIGATILFSDEVEKDSQLYSFLTSKGRIKNTKNLLRKSGDIEEKRVKQKSFYENVLQAISFTVTKIEILKKLAGFTNEELDSVNNILLERRIVNIKERFIMIKSELDKIPGIREMAR